MNLKLAVSWRKEKKSKVDGRVAAGWLVQVFSLPGEVLVELESSRQEKQLIGVRPLLAISYVALLKSSLVVFQCPWCTAFECLVHVPLRPCIMLLQA